MWKKFPKKVAGAEEALVMSFCKSIQGWAEENGVDMDLEGGEEEIGGDDLEGGEEELESVAKKNWAAAKKLESATKKRRAWNADGVSTRAKELARK